MSLILHLISNFKIFHLEIAWIFLSMDTFSRHDVKNASIRYELLYFIKKNVHRSQVNDKMNTIRKVESLRRTRIILRFSRALLVSAVASFPIHFPCDVRLLNSFDWSLQKIFWYQIYQNLFIEEKSWSCWIWALSSGGKVVYSLLCIVLKRSTVQGVLFFV